MDASTLSPRRRGPLAALTAALIGLVALVALLPAAAKAAPVQAQSAAAFVDSIGVNTHTYYSDTVYASRFDTIVQRLRELGVHHIRENLVPNRPDQYAHLNELAAAGVKSTLIMGAPEDGSAGLGKLTSILASDLRGSVDAVEGPNEYDLTGGGGDWMSRLAPYQQQLYTAIKSNPATSSLPVIGPSLGNTNSQGGDVAGSLDFGNIHSYPNGEAPELNVSRMLRMASDMSGSKPVMATETGYHTAVNFDGDHQPASEAAQATYMPRLFLDYFSQGVARTFSYELVDEFPDPAQGEAESNFGLLHNDLSPKPAFTALRNLVAILADSGTPSPGSLDYSVSGDTRELHQVLLQKSDGSFYLALWREESVWDNHARSAVSAASGSVQLSFANALTGAEEFAPNSSAQPLRALDPAAPLALKVGPQVTIVHLMTSGQPAVGGIKVWVSKRAVESGSRVAVKGQLTGAASGQPTAVKIQRLSQGAWRTFATGKATGNGRFAKLIRLVGRPQAGPSRIRVVAARAKPSNQVRVRILARDGGSAAPAVALSAGTAVAGA